jgi:hypothetical protein
MLKFRLDRLSLEKLYLSFIRPLLEYGDVVWDPHNMYLINILEIGIKVDKDARVKSFCILNS